MSTFWLVCSASKSSSRKGHLVIAENYELLAQRAKHRSKGPNANEGAAPSPAPIDWVARVQRQWKIRRYGRDGLNAARLEFTRTRLRQAGEVINPVSRFVRCAPVPKLAGVGGSVKQIDLPARLPAMREGAFGILEPQIYLIAQIEEGRVSTDAKTASRRIPSRV